MFIHNVYFWLKKSAPATTVQQMSADTREALAKIPNVLHIWTGKPTGLGRPIVDNSYAVGLCVVFPDAAAHDVYQEHPLHKQFIAKYGGEWERVQVYDFVA